MPSSKSTLDLYVLTANCGSTVVNPDVLSTYLFDGLDPQKRKEGDLPEILVLNLQELLPLGPAFLGDPWVERYFEAFRRSVQLALRRDKLKSDNYFTGSYTNIYSRNVGTTAIMVFVRRDVHHRVGRLETAGVGTSTWVEISSKEWTFTPNWLKWIRWHICGQRRTWLEEMPNKGAVGVRMAYKVHPDPSVDGKEVELTFISAHLEAHEKNLEARNKNWKQICKGLVFIEVGSEPQLPKPRIDDEETTLLGRDSDSEEDEDGDVYGIFKPSSHLFFAGDLNYRTSDQKPTKTDHDRFPQPAQDENEPKHWRHLLRHDQLIHERSKNRVFQGMSEAPIEFAPTYKYATKKMRSKPFDDDYQWYPWELWRWPIDDKAQSWPWAEKRWPSWCDRILYLDLPPWMAPRERTTRSKKDNEKNTDRLVVHSYTSLPAFKWTDHRPVVLSVEVPLKPIPKPPSSAGTEVRLNPPYAIDKDDWYKRRVNVRKREIFFGAIMCLFWTWEGWVVLLGLALVAVFGWFLIWDTVEHPLWKA